MSDKNYICPNCNEITLHSQGDNFVCDSCEHTFTSKDTEYGGIKFIDTTEFKSNEGLSESQVSTAVSDEAEISDDNQELELNQEDYYYKLYLNLKNIVADIGNYFKDITDDLVKYLNDRGFFELSDKNIFIKQDSYLDHTYTSILDFSNGILDLSANVELDNDIVDDFDTIHLTMNESVIDDILDDLESKGRDNWSEADWELINHVNTEAGKFEGAKKDQTDDKVLVENDTDSSDNLDNDTNLDSNTLTTTDDTIDDSNIKFKYLKIEFAETSGAPSDSIIETAMDKEFTSIDDLNKILFIADSEFRNFWSQNGGVFGYDKVYISAYYEDVTTNTVYELSPLLRIDLGDGKYGKDYISIKNKNIKLGAESIMQFIENGTSTNRKVKIVTESKENYSKNLNVKDVWLENFDGTYDSVNRICEILGTTRKDLTRAYIPDSVTEIGDHAFIHCTSLTSVIIPNSVTELGKLAFSDCHSLTNVTIPNSVTEIHKAAFRYCTSLKSITMPNNLKYIEDEIFYGCRLLKSINIPSGITSIGESAFEDCDSLTRIIIPDSVIEIGDRAFSFCRFLTSITIPDKVIEIGLQTFMGCESLTSIIIPNSVTEIGRNAFNGCTSLTVTTNNLYIIHYCEKNDIPVKSLKESLFNSKNNLILEGTRYDKQASKILSDSGLFDPETANAIIDGLFKNDIHAFVHSPNWLEKYLKGIARMCVEESNGDKNKAIKFLNDSPQVFDKYLTWVKENREKYGTKLDDEFNNKLSYKDVVDFLDKIQAELDQQSEKELSNMNFSSSNYELVPIDSFEQFNSLFGGKATGDGSSDRYAGGGGTAWCHANSENTYNSSSWAGNPYHKFYVLANKDWKKINFDAESNSNNPKDDYGNSLIALLVDTRTGRLLNATLRCNHVGVSSNADNQYKTYSELSKIAGFNVKDAIMNDLDISIDSNTSVKDVWYKYFDGTADSVDKICEILDISREDITEVYIPDNITSIRFNAFDGCTSLTSVKIPNSVTSIGGCAFEGCSSLTSITIPNSVTSIGHRAFFRCKSLTSITIPNGVTTIDSYTFYECTSLTSITIPDSVTRIGIFTFSGCTSLTNITIPNSVTEIGSYVFHNCTSLTNITIPDSVTVIGIGAFNDCTSLKNITISNGVTEIGAGTFAGCKSLTSVKIPDSVTEISSNAFYRCTSLTSITIPDSVTYIDNSTFRDCTSLTVITNNPYVIEYCENNNIPVKSSENTKENYNIAYSKTKKAIEESYNYDNDDDFIIEDFLPFSKYMPFTD